MRVHLSAAEARRAAIGAQGLGSRERPNAADVRHIRRVMRTTGLLQLDFVNVLVPAHRMVVFSRAGAHDDACFHRAVYRHGDYTEQWAHEASIVPTAAWPLFDYRRRRFRQTAYNPLTRDRKHHKYLEEIFEFVKEYGASASSDLPSVPTSKRRPGDWHRSKPRWALEHHFGIGALAVKERLPNFQRVYDLSERVIPERYLGQRVGTLDAQRELLKIAARACGVASASDLADYFRISPREARPRIGELVENGDLREVEVEGWSETGYLGAGARIPRNVDAAALLSPFDPLVWCRPRAERLFGFHYRIEIYVPAAKRRWGYYVLPFLLGDRLVARVDLKAERKNSTLSVRAAYREDHAGPSETASALAAELRQLADWLSLERIQVGRRGNLANPLRRACRG